MKRIFRALTYLSLLIVFGLASSSSASATSYDVSASVPFAVPTQAATINSALNNITVQNAAFVISGSCQILTPSSVISVWRGSTSLGSQSCASGNFSLQIVLSEGVNSLVVRTANVSSVYGPDSSPTVVTLHTPVNPPPAPETPKSSKPTAPGETNLTPADNTAINNATKVDLTIVPQEPFSVLPKSNQVSLSFYIDGGSTPYTIELNWGDGTTETKVVEKPGNYTFSHQYRSPGNYAVKGRVKDVLGAVTEINHAVVVAKPAEQPVKITSVQAKPGVPVISWVQKHWIATGVGVSVAGIAAVAYWVGQTAAMNAAAANSAAGAQANSSKGTRKVKPKVKR